MILISLRAHMDYIRNFALLMASGYIKRVVKSYWPRDQPLISLSHDVKSRLPASSLPPHYNEKLFGGDELQVRMQNNN